MWPIIKRTQQSLRDMGGENIQRSNACIPGIWEEQKENEEAELFDEIKVENFSKLIKDFKSI